MAVYLQLAGADLAVEILITVADVVVLVPMLSMSLSLSLLLLLSSCLVDHDNRLKP